MDDDYDTPWKRVVTRYFRDFMAFYSPDACAAIDWSRPYAFLDQELAALSADAAVGPRVLDKLVSVHLREGGEQWVLVHLEVQVGRDADFAERIFIYHYRVYDHYRNPFALVTAAHLLTQKTRRNADLRHAAKWRLTRLLYARDWDRERIIDLYNVIDWMMRLPKELDAQFRADVFALSKGKAMRYINNFERAGIEKGLQRGMQQGYSKLLIELLRKRFGELDSLVVLRLAAADADDLSTWALNFLDARSLAEVFGD